MAAVPWDLLEYVVVHEMAHLLEPSHNERFVAILDRHWPQWRESRAELNALSLGHEDWDAGVHGEQLAGHGRRAR